MRLTGPEGLDDAAAHVPFPGLSFANADQFDDYCRKHKPELDERYLYEIALATAAPEVTLDGTCAPCLRATRFTSMTAGGTTRKDGRIVPNWREQLVCDCVDRLGNRPRALLHFLQASVGLRHWSRVVLFGPMGGLEHRFAARLPQMRSIPALSGPAGRPPHALPIASASTHLILSSDYLHRVPPLDQALSEFRRVLVTGGAAVFTVPFRYRSEHTISHLEQLPRTHGLPPAEYGREVHELGWDLLGRLLRAGFSRACAHVYWCEELGYLGSFNMLFAATV